VLRRLAPHARRLDREAVSSERPKLLLIRGEGPKPPAPEHALPAYLSITGTPMGPDHGVPITEESLARSEWIAWGLPPCVSVDRLYPPVDSWTDEQGNSWSVPQPAWNSEEE
jgi:hypothetical protein